MHSRSLALVVLALFLAVLPPRLGAEDKAILIELDTRGPSALGGVSTSGSVAVGALFDGGTFYWMPTTGAIYTGGLSANDVSRDGKTIVGEALDSRGIQNAAIWLRAAEWRLLGSFPNATPCGTELSSALDTSADGRVVVGFARYNCARGSAFRWEESTGMVDLGSLVPDRVSFANGISGNARVITGYQERADGFRAGARWVDGPEELIPSPRDYPLGYVGTARGANNDGSIVVGDNCRPGQIPEDQSAWVWTAQDGTVCLPAPQRRPSPGPLILVEAQATSDDGRVIGGGQGVAGSQDSNAIIWIDKQPFYLKDYLRANGIPNAFATWVNTGEISDISADGRIIVGSGAALRGFGSYMVILPASLVKP